MTSPFRAAALQARAIGEAGEPQSFDARRSLWLGAIALPLIAVTVWLAMTASFDIVRCVAETPQDADAASRQPACSVTTVRPVLDIISYDEGSPDAP